MKRRLLLLRHGKSDWDADYDSDADRPLAPRGKKAAQRIGRLLAKLGEIPDQVTTSSARRARDTVTLAAKAGNWDCPVEQTRGLYEASPEDVLEVIRETEDPVGRLLVAGHEPTWSALAEGLIGGGKLQIPTAALLRIDLAVERWNEVEFGSGTLRWMVTPKMLEGAGLK